MIDTVCLKHRFVKPLNDDALRLRGAKPLRSRRNKTWALNPTAGEYWPRVTFIFTPDAMMHVYAETSVAGLLFGHNARLPTESEAHGGARAIADYVQYAVGLPFPYETATVSEIHFTRDLPIGQATAATAPLRLYNRDLPRFKKWLFEHTLYFKSRSATVRVYDKFAEVRTKKRGSTEALESARGNLRIEYAAKDRAVKAIVERFGLADQSPDSLLSVRVSDRVLDKLIADLDIDRLADHTSNLERLLRTYSLPKAWRLSGFLRMEETYGDQFYLDPKWSYKKRQFDAARHDCIRAGAYPNVLDNIGTLDTKIR